MIQKLEKHLTKPITECTPTDIYYALLAACKESLTEKGFHKGKKKVYYISAEFLSSISWSAMELSLY